MTQTISVSDARAALPAILDRVLAGEEVTLTRHGRAVAVIVRPDLLRVRRSDGAATEAERVSELLDHGRRTSLSKHALLTPQQGDSLLAEVAASRADR